MNDVKALSSRKPTERSASLQTFEAVLAGWLRVWSRLYDKELTEELMAIYRELVAGIEPQQLAAACKEVSKRAKFFPKPAEIWEVIRTSVKTAAQVDVEAEWQRVFDYLQWYPSEYRKPKFSEQIERAVRAAGGWAFIAECPLDDLQWAKKRFVEAFMTLSASEDSAHLLGGKEQLRQIVAGIEDHKRGDRQ